MWALRVLTGPQAGQMHKLKPGRNILGRNPQNDIVLVSPGISKEHAEINVSPERIFFTDLRSSNGSFINGVRIQSGVIHLGDKLGLHDLLCDIIPAPVENRVPAQPRPTMPSQYTQSTVMPSYTPQMSGADGNMPAPAPAYTAPGWRGLLEKFQTYIDTVALPGVYKLPEFFEFKLVLLGFVGVFIFATTLLAMIPMVEITKSSITAESKRRAGSIARTLAVMNQSALLQNNYSILSTNAAEAEEGVKQVLIVQQSDGMILAPASRAGTTPDLPFVHTARREMRPIAVEVDSSTIGTSFPIGLYDPSTGEQSVKAHAIVLYDIKTLAFDEGRVLSLFLQTLVIAFFAGIIIYYFMYKLIEFPLVSINAQLDTAMRERGDHTEIAFQFPALQALVGNINSLLSRYIQGDSHTGGMSSGGHFNRDAEAENLVGLVGFPCVTISREGRFIASNSRFAMIARLDSHQLQGQGVSVIPDVAFQKNIEGLVSRTRENPRQVQTDHLEFAGEPCVISCQGLLSSSGEIEYFLLTVAPVEGNSG